MKNQLIFILCIICLCVICLLILKIFNQAGRLSRLENQVQEFPTIQIESLNKEFTVRIGEIAIVEQLHIMVQENLVVPMVSSRSKNNSHANGIRVLVKERDRVQRYDFEDGGDPLVYLDEYILELKSRVPGTGTFVVSRK